MSSLGKMIFETIITFWSFFNFLVDRIFFSSFVEKWIHLILPFLGSIVGGIATFFAVTKTLNQNEKHFFNSQEYKRSEVMPLLNFSSFSKFSPVDKVLEKKIQLVDKGMFVNTGDVDDYLRDNIICIENCWHLKPPFAELEKPLISVNVLNEVYIHSDDNTNILEKGHFVIYELHNSGMNTATDLKLKINDNIEELDFILTTQTHLIFVFTFSEGFKANLNLRFIFNDIFSTMYYQDFEIEIDQKNSFDSIKTNLPKIAINNDPRK